MHRLHRRDRLVLSFVALTVVLALGLGASNLVLLTPAHAKEDPPAAQVVQEAWRSAQEAGSYHFTTEIEQTTYPAPALVNVGRSSRREKLYLRGETNANLPGTRNTSGPTLQMTMWDGGGSILNPQDGIEIRVEDDRAFGRQGAGPWQEIDDFSGSFAPGKDLLGYLAGATNIREIEADTRAMPGRKEALEYKRYVFDVDGPGFSQYLRDQMEDYYRKKGELPMGLTLESPREYQAVTGEGEIWIDEQRMPLRLSVHLVYPPKRNGQRIEADITTDFSRFSSNGRAASSDLSAAPGTGIAAALRLPRDRAAWHQLGQQGFLGLVTLGLLLSVVFYRRARHVYTIVALTMILAMVLGPLLQSHHVHAFSRKLAEQRTEQKEAEEAREAARQQQEAIVSADWDPHQDPLSRSPALEQRSPVQGETAASVPQKDVGAAVVPPTESLSALSLSSNLQRAAAEEDRDPDGDDDGDTLTNLQEERLGTDPNDDDTDGDGITDDAEVHGFEALDGQMYYLDPLSADTNGDGLTDGMECPQLLRRSSTALSPAATCQNTDGELEDDSELPRVPDAFDGDNDGDGVPDKVDLSPYSAVGSSQSPFNRRTPLPLSVEDLQAGQPVLVDLQIRPKNSDHLAYALNVLDWPTGDNDGQIQRVLDTTFGSHMSADQLAEEPAADNGEMRLVPMLEVDMSGASAPLPLTTPVITVAVDSPEISATVRLEQDAGDLSRTTIEWTLGEAGSYNVGLFEGPCPVTPPSDSSEYPCTTAGSTQTCSIESKVTAVADGGHHLIFRESDETWACQAVGNVVNGPYEDRMIDPAPLEIYGITVREKNDDGGLLAYAPVSVVEDELGSHNVAFASRLMYEVGSGWDAGAWGRAPEIRLVWLVQMLTDVCNPDGLPEDPTDEEIADHCSDPANRTEQTQFVHTYDDAWYLTGLSVREDHGLDVAIAYENPASDEHPDNDDYLWLLAKGLEGSFVSGRVGAGGKRDMTVSKIKQTFDITSTAAVTPTRWNIPQDALRVESYGPDQFPQQAHLAKISTHAEGILNSDFLVDGEPASEAPTLLIAREEHYRSVNLDEDAAARTGGGVDVSFSDKEREVVAAFQWRPYRYRDNAWEAYPIAEYMDLVSVRLSDQFQQIPELYDPDYPDEDYARLALDTEILAWQSRYLSYYQGLANLVQIGPEAYELQDVVLTNKDLADTAGSWTVKGIGLGSLAVQLAMTQDILDHLAKQLKKEAEVANRIVAGLLFEEAAEIGKELDKGATSQSQGKLGKLKLSDVAGGLVKGIDITLAVASVLTMAMAMGGSRDWEIAMYVVGVVSAVWSVSKAIYNLAVHGASEGIETVVKIFGISTSTAKVAGVIGLIVSGIMAFGFFIYAVASAGLEFFGLAFNALLAQTIAQVVVAAIMFAISMIPVVGQLIAAIIAIIDSLVYLICGAIGEEAQENVVGQWLCKGLSGLATEMIKGLIYNTRDLVDMQLENRLQTFNFDWAFAAGSERKGSSVGSELDVSLGVTSTIQLNHVFPEWEEMLEGWKNGTQLIPIDWKSLAYGWQFNNEKLKGATFRYRLQTVEDDFHEELSRDAMSSEWQATEDDVGKYEIAPFFVVKHPETGSEPLLLNQSGINQVTDLYLSEGYNAPIQECWTMPAGPLCMTCPACPFACLVPVCYIRDNDATNHIHLGQNFILDVFPATLDGFYEPAEKDGGYSLAWGQSAAVTSTLLGGAPLVFPRQLDFDGDGLQNVADGGSDPNDSTWDTDGDRLSDLFELQTGSDPNEADSDGDGLTDQVEARLGTNSYRADTDGDGLTDAQETNGWEFVYDITVDGDQLRTWVTSDPLSSDGDGDGWTDFQEKTYGLHPRVGTTTNLLSLDSQVEEYGAPQLLLRFDDQPDTATFGDASGYEHAGICAQEGCPTITEGRYGRGVQLDGQDDRVSTTLHLDQSRQGGGATMMAWAYPDSVSSANQQVISTNDGNRDWSLLHRDGQWRVFIGDGAERASGSVDVGQWQHVAVVFDPQRGTALFKNGDQIGDWRRIYHNAQAGPVTVGATPSGNDYFDGRIDETSVFDRALTEAEIEAAMAGRYNPSDLVVAAGDKLAYEATVRNELLGRQAQGLLQTDLPPAFSDSTIAPTTFVLLPQDEETMAGTVGVAEAASSGAVTVTQIAGASITDWREQCGFAELWLPLNEGEWDTSFTDHCGGLPARGATCSGSHCPDREEPGYFDYGMAFDGIDDYLTLRQGGKDLPADVLGLKDGSFSVSVWVKGTALDFGSGDRAVLGTDEQTTNEGLMLGLRNGRPHIAFHGNGLHSEYQLHPGRWYHLVFRYDLAQEEMAIFVNGEPKAVEGNHSAFQGEGILHVGRAQGGSPFSGTIDDLRVFSRSLTRAEIRVLYGQPVLEMTFEDTYPYDDSSGFGNAAAGWPCTYWQPPGITGKALGFDEEQSRYCELKGSQLPSMDLNNSAFSWAMWLYPSSGYAFPQGIVGKYLGFASTGTPNQGAAKRSYPSLLRIGRRLRFGFGADTDGDGEGDRWMPVDTDDVLEENAWNHVVVSFGPVYDENGQFDQNRVTFFVNGERVRSEGVGNAAVGYSDEANETINLGRVSHKAQVTLSHLQVVEEGDGAGSAEIYMEWNDERICDGANEPDKGGGCRSDGMGDEDIWQINTTKNVFNSGWLEVWEQDSADVSVDGGPDCIRDDQLIAKNFRSDDPGSGQLVVLSASAGGCLAYGATEVDLFYSYSNPSVPFHGRIDDLSLYKRALSLEETEELYLSTFAAMHLRMDESPGSDTFENAVDLSGQSNGFCSGSGCPTSGVSGRENQAALFDGHDDFVSTNLTLDQSNSGDGATLMAWIYPHSTDSGRQHVISTDNGNGDWSLLQSGDQWRVLAGGGHELTAGSVDVGEWQHVAVIFEPGRGTKLFKNGERIGNWREIDQTTSSGDVTLAATPGGGAFFDGRIDDVRIFNHALRGTDVRKVYRSAPLFQLHLDEAQGATEFADASGNSGAGQCLLDCPRAGFKGQVGLAPSFDGVDDGIAFPDDAHLDLSSFSVGAWVRPTEVFNREQTLIGKGSNYELKLSANGLTPTLGTMGSTWQRVESDVPLQFNTWSHVMGTYDDETKELAVYVNGYRQGRKTMPADFTPSTSVESLTVGGPSDLAGRIDEVVVHGRALSQFEVRDLFLYQGKWVEDRQSTGVIVDNDLPLSVLRSYSDTFPHRPNQDVVMHVEARDATSGASMVEVCTCYDDTASCCADETNWVAAPRCQDGSGTAWCPTFNPTKLNGEGTYVIQTRATDGVGHREVPTRSYTLHVDDTPPHIEADIGEGELVTAQAHPTERNAQTVHLSGRIDDPDIAGGAPGSGLQPGTFKVALVTPEGVIVGQKTEPTVEGSDWSVDYALTGPSPTGPYLLRVEASDAVGNQETQDLVTFQLDAAAPSVVLDRRDTPLVIDPGVTLEGMASELPVLPKTELTLHFEEESGATTFRDTSGWGRDGKCSGSGCPTTIEGKYGHALAFDGAGQFVDLSDLQSGNESISGTIGLAAWVKPAEKDGHQSIIVHGRTTSPPRGVFLEIADGKYQVGSYDGAEHKATSVIPDQDIGQWVHLAGTYDGTQWRLYRNGRQVGATASAVGAVAVDAAWAVGASGTEFDRFFHGAIDEVVVLDRALSTEEVRALAQPQVSGVQQVETSFAPILPGSPLHNALPPEGEVLHLPLEDGRDEEGQLTFTDISGQGNAGTCVSTQCPALGKDGHLAAAVGFDGSDDNIRLANFGTFTATTVSAWVYRDAHSQEGRVVSYKSDADCGFLLAYQTSDDDSVAEPLLRLRANDGWVAVSDDNAIPEETWVHLAGTYDGQTVRLYRDGEEVASTAAPGELNQCIGETVIGQALEGRLDDIRMWDRALPAAEVADVYHGQAPLLHLALDETWAVNGTSLQDASGWNHQATLHTFPDDASDSSQDTVNKLVPGKVGASALSLDGVDDYVSVGTHPALDLSQGPFSIGLWVRPEGTDTEKPVLGSGAYTVKKESYPFINLDGDQVHYGYGNGDVLESMYSGSMSPVVPQSWNHIVLIYDGARLTVYVNGTQTGFMNAADAPWPTSRFDIGRGVDPDAGSGAPECATITGLRLTPHTFDRRYRIKVNGDIVFETEDYPTPGEQVLPELSIDFCSGATIEVERFEWYTNAWRPMGAHNNTATTWPRTDQRAEFLGDGRYVELLYNVTNQRHRMRYFEGQVDDVRIYPRALTSTEVEALYQIGWHEAAQTGPGSNQTTWSAAAPPGLEGEYRLDLRARDGAGSVSDPYRDAWGGPVDTLAPRASLTRETLGANYRYTATATDFNLTDDHFSSPCGDGRTASRTAFQPPWYRSLSAAIEGEGESRLYTLESTCLVSATAAYGYAGGENTPGRAVDVVVHQAPSASSVETLAYVADQTGGLQIADVSVVSETGIAGALDLPGYAHAVAVQTQAIAPSAGEMAQARKPVLPAVPPWQSPGRPQADLDQPPVDVRSRPDLDGANGTSRGGSWVYRVTKLGPIDLPSVWSEGVPSTDSARSVEPSSHQTGQDESSPSQSSQGSALAAGSGFSVTVTSPSGSDAPVAPGEVISVALSQTVDQGTVTTRTFMVAGRQTGAYAGTYSLGSILFDAARDYAPGERVDVRLTDGIEAQDGTPLAPYTWQFRGAVERGTGLFAPGQLLNSGQSGAWPTALGMGDLDADGDLDALIGDLNEGSTVWVNQGGKQGGTVGAYSDSGQRMVITGTEDLALGDVDGDGDLDAVFGCGEGDASQVWSNDGQAGFTQGASLESRDTLAVALGDVDGDGDLDIFMGNGGWSPHQPNEVWLNDGSGSFTDSGQRLGEADTQAVALGDLDGDGDLDAVTGNYSGDYNSQAALMNKIWLNQGGAQGGAPGVFSMSDEMVGEMTWDTRDVTLGDVDGDGDLDALVGANYDPSTVWLNDGTASFTYTVSQTLAVSSTFATALKDMDGDGDLDAYLANFEQPNTVWLNDGSGGFTDSGQRLGNEFSVGVAAGDVEGDGDLDVLVLNAGEEEELNRLWLNGGVARDDQFYVEQDSSGNVLPLVSNDVRSHGDMLSLTAVTTSSHGTIAIDGGTAIYTPAAGYTGVDSFAYTAADRLGATSSADVVVRVGEANTSPRVQDDIATIEEDTPAVVHPLDNDGDADGDTPYLTSTGAPSHGTLSHIGNLVVYTPSVDYNADVGGSDVLTYTVSDGELTDTGVMTITVLPVNDPPTFTVGADQEVEEDTGSRVVTDWATDISAGPTDEVGQEISFAVHTDNSALFAAEPTVDAGGTLAFTPAADANGRATAWVTLHDDGGRDRGGEDSSMPQTFAITVTNVNDPPSAAPDQATTPQRVAVRIPVLDNDTDIEEDTLRVEGVTAPANGVAVSDGSDIVYTSTRYFYGLDVFTYTVADTAGLTDSAPVSVTVTDVDDPPTIDPISDVTINEDGGEQVIDLTGLTTGPDDGQTLYVTALSTDTTLIPHPDVEYDGSGTTGSLRFTPVADRHGQAAVQVEVSDGFDEIHEFFVVTVDPVNDPPSLDPIDDVTTWTGFVEQTVRLSGIAAGGGETQTLTVTAISTNTAVVPHPTVDYVSPSEEGTLRFSPTEEGGLAAIQVTVSDGLSQTTRGFNVVVEPGETRTIAYVANEPYGVRAVDVSDPADPILMDTYGFESGRAFDVAISGTHRYVAQGHAGLDVIDVSNLANPTLLGRCTDLAGEAQGVAISGHYAYVAVGQGGLQVVDVSDPSSPLAVARVDTPDIAEDVVVEGSYAYVADVGGGLRVIDIADPTSPVEVGSYRPDRPTATGEYARSVAVSGNYAYVANFYGGLQIVDISTPSNPEARGSCAGWPNVASGVAVVGERVYLAGTDGLIVVDVSDPDAPMVVGKETNTFSGYLYSVAISGPYGYVGDSDGMVVVNLSDPDNPAAEGRLDADMGRGISLMQHADCIYLAAGNDGLVVVDVSDPGAPTKVGSYSVPMGRPKDIAVSGEYAYVAALERGLQIVNVSDPSSLTSAGSYEPGGEVVGVTLPQEGPLTYAYLACGNEGISIVDVSDPEAPVLAASFDTPGFARDVAVVGDPSAPDPAYALVTDGWRLEIYDISDLSTGSTKVASLLLEEMAYAVNVRASSTGGEARTFAYVSTGPGGLITVDVTDPRNPVLWQVVKTTGYALGSDVFRRFGFVAGGGTGLEIYDLEGPAARLRACDTAGNCTLVAPTDLDGGAGEAVQIETEAEEPPLAVRLGNVPTLVGSKDTLSLSGWAYASASTLATLTVKADGVSFYDQDWTGQGVTETLWSTGWSPSEGTHVLEAVVSDAAGAEAKDVTTVTVDTMAPLVAVEPLVITSTRYREPRTIDLSGLVTDTGGVTGVRIGVGRPGESLTLSNDATLVTDPSAPSTASGWRTGWYLGTGELPDNASYRVSAEATDVAGHSTRVTETVTVDIVPPTPVELSLHSGGEEIAPSDTVTETNPTLSLAWTPSSDGSGLGDYLVRWTTQITASASSETSTSGSLSASHTAGDGQRLSVDLACQDAYGQQTWQSFGPIYADSPRTPDFVYLESDSSTYRGWMDSGCSLIGVDRRLARRAASGSALSAEQRFYATWSDEALRLAWTGADWRSDGDLFVYLDTRSDGATEAFDPHVTTTVSLPDSVQADSLVWVRDDEHALLMSWNVVSNTWEFDSVLSPSFYQFEGDVNQGQTDLYLPFDLLGVVNPASNPLDIVAFASEDEALRLWAVLPHANPVSSDRVIETEPAASESRNLTLTHGYHWDALSAGICPNGSDAPTSPTAFLDSEVQADLTVDPAGATYSLLGDDLFWLRDLLLDAPADVTSHLDFIGTGYPPVADGEEVTYTLAFRNLGTDPAYGVSATLTSDYALVLSGGGQLDLGEIQPGERVTRTFHGVVDATRSEETWAALQVQVFDTAHPSTGEPLDWLWAQHQVDVDPPVFFGIQDPVYHIASGENNLAGYAYDASQVSEVEGQESDGTPLFACSGAEVGKGRWTCMWDTSGASHGDVFDVQLRAADSADQWSEWSQAQSFVVDAEPPSLTLDERASSASDGGEVRASYTLVGDVSDAGGVAGVEVCVDDACGQADVALSGTQSAVTYEDVPSSPIAIDATTSCAGGEVTRSFDVTDDFAIHHVQVGLNAAHARRDDLQVTLQSPTGTVVELLRDDSISGTSFENYDVLLRDAAAASYSASDDNPAPPFYERIARPYQPLRTLQGEEAFGEWSLRICDINPDTHHGVYNQSRLTLYPRDITAKSGRWAYDVPVPDGLDNVSQTVTIHAEDVVGNETAEPVSLMVWVDNVAPVITVTNALTEVLAYSSETVLQGTASDGGQVSSMLISVETPRGLVRNEPAVRHSEPWDYVLSDPDPGTHTLWAVATDQAGNSESLGPFEVNAGCSAANPTAAILNVEPAADSPYSATVSAVLTNTGSAALAPGLPVGIHVNGTSLTTVTTTHRLEAGASRRFSVTWPITAPGVYDLAVLPNEGEPVALCSTATSDNRTIAIQDVSLYESWNLISSLVNPYDGRVDVVQRTIAGQYVVISSFENGALSYYPDLPAGLNTLQTMDGEHGYWLKAVGSQSASETVAPKAAELEEQPPVGTLRMMGRALPEDHPIQLEAGWNLVSYLPEQMLTVPVALQHIDGLYTAVLGFEPDEGALSHYQDLDSSYNTLEWMKPGYGYWIKMVETATLQYPLTQSSITETARSLTTGDAVRAADSDLALTEAANDVTFTDSWVNLHGPANDEAGTPLSVGTTILALDPDGVVCGATSVAVEGQYGVLPCYGDDQTTAEDEGADPGDVIQLVVDGQVLGRGIWTAHGDRQLAPLGRLPYALYLPLVIRGGDPSERSEEWQSGAPEPGAAEEPQAPPVPSSTGTPFPTSPVSPVPGATSIPSTPIQKRATPDGASAPP